MKKAFLIYFSMAASFGLIAPFMVLYLATHS